MIKRLWVHCDTLAFTWVWFLSICSSPVGVCGLEEGHEQWRMTERSKTLFGFKYLLFSFLLHTERSVKSNQLHVPDELTLQGCASPRPAPCGSSGVLLGALCTCIILILILIVTPRASSRLHAASARGAVPLPVRTRTVQRVAPCAVGRRETHHRSHAPGNVRGENSRLSFVSLLIRECRF